VVATGSSFAAFTVVGSTVTLQWTTSAGANASCGRSSPSNEVVVTVR